MPGNPTQLRPDTVNTAWTVFNLHRPMMPPPCTIFTTVSAVPSKFELNLVPLTIVKRPS